MTVFSTHHGVKTRAAITVIKPEKAGLVAGWERYVREDRERYYGGTCNTDLG